MASCSLVAARMHINGRGTALTNRRALDALRTLLVLLGWAWSSRKGLLRSQPQPRRIQLQQRLTSYHGEDGHAWTPWKPRDIRARSSGSTPLYFQKMGRPIWTTARTKTGPAAPKSRLVAGRTGLLLPATVNQHDRHRSGSRHGGPTTLKKHVLFGG